MTMTYSDFKTYIITHLWKAGDAVVIANLDNIIATANAELNRVLKVEDRTTSLALSITTNSYTLPADFREMRMVTVKNIGLMEYLPPQDFAQMQNGYPNDMLVYYTIVNKALRFTGGMSVSVPLTGELVYYANVPDFKVTDVSWMADNYFDVYLYCVLKHTAPFLREDERVQMWTTYYDTALNSAIEENENRKYGGSPLTINFN